MSRLPFNPASLIHLIAFFNLKCLDKVEKAGKLCFILAIKIKNGSKLDSTKMIFLTDLFFNFQIKTVITGKRIWHHPKRFKHGSVNSLDKHSSVVDEEADQREEYEM